MWVSRRVAQAVEAGNISADLLAKLSMRMERARERPQVEGHALAIQAIAKQLKLPVDQVAESWLPSKRNRPRSGNCCCGGSWRRAWRGSGRHTAQTDRPGSPMAFSEKSRERPKGEKPLPFRLGCHLCCLNEGATDPAIPTPERLALVRDRVMCFRDIRRKLDRDP